MGQAWLAFCTIKHRHHFDKSQNRLMLGRIKLFVEKPFTVLYIKIYIT